MQPVASAEFNQLLETLSSAQRQQRRVDEDVRASLSHIAVSLSRVEHTIAAMRHYEDSGRRLLTPSVEAAAGGEEAFEVRVDESIEGSAWALASGASRISERIVELLEHIYVCRASPQAAAAAATRATPHAEGQRDAATETSTPYAPVAFKAHNGPASSGASTSLSAVDGLPQFTLCRAESAATTPHTESPRLEGLLSDYFVPVSLSEQLQQAPRSEPVSVHHRGVNTAVRCVAATAVQTAFTEL